MTVYTLNSEINYETNAIWIVNKYLISLRNKFRDGINMKGQGQSNSVE